MSIVCVKRASAGLAIGGLAWLAMADASLASDWSRFRGPNGSGVSSDSDPVPAQWSDTQNLKWSVELPGKGVSCPIVVGDRVVVTAWSGNGPDDLMRHVVCYDKDTGDKLWSKDIKPVVKDEPYEGMFTQTGYTANTPASDGERIYCFFGVSGVYAFDLDGNEIWGPVSVGTEFDERKWGTASSLALCKDLVIVTAASESKSIVALRKSDGEEAWNYPSPQLNGTWSTPVVVELADGREEIVFSVPGFIWGFDVDGNQVWTCKGADSNSACGSPIAHDGIVYAIGGREGGGIAVRAGGKGDVTETHVVWTGNQRARIGTPVYQDGLIYWIADGIANCIEADTGEKVYQERLKAPEAVAQRSSVFHFVQQTTENADAASQQQADAPQQRMGRAQDAGQQPGQGQGQGQGGVRRFGGGGGRGGRGGGGFMSQDYSSPVAADGKLYFVRRNGDVYVLALGREYKDPLAINKFEGEADYSATPAISDGKIYIRSSKKLYCVGSDS